MQAEVEEAKRSLYRAQQKLLAQAQAAEAREHQRTAELAADEAARRAQSAQEAAAMRARRQEMEQISRKACVLSSSTSALSCMLHREPFAVVLLLRVCAPGFYLRFMVGRGWEVSASSSDICTGGSSGGDGAAGTQRIAALALSAGTWGSD